jgi:hypothetical protein
MVYSLLHHGPDVHVEADTGPCAVAAGLNIRVVLA